MTRTTPLAGLVLLAGAGLCWAQAPSPLSYSPPPPPPPGAALDPAPAGASLFDGPPTTPGLFFAAEVALLYPTVTGRITNQMPIGLTGSFLDVPRADLDLAISPTFEVGHRLADCQGQYSLAYRFLFADGTGEVTDEFGNRAAVRSRLEMHIVDLDYGTAPYEFAPRYEVSARIGGRVAYIDFDSTASSGALTEQAGSRFFGAGIHGRLDVERRVVVVPGLSLFGRADGAVLVGEVEQDFSRTQDFIGFSAGSTMNQRGNQTVPSLTLQAGLSYAPPSLPGFKLTGGYQYERYFNVGKISNTSSDGDVWSHGGFLRGQVDF